MSGGEVSFDSTLLAYADLKEGDKITIAGYRVGKQFPTGFTTRCKPGNETVLVVTRIHTGGILKPAVCEEDTPQRASKRVQPQLMHGPARRKRW